MNKNSKRECYKHKLNSVLERITEMIWCSIKNNLTLN